jgi:MFS family permease
MITSGLMLIGTVGGGFLGNLDLAFPYVVRALLLAIVGGWAYLYMHDIGYTPRAIARSAIPAEMRKVAQESITYGWQQRPVRLIMIVTFIQGLYGIWGFYATQPYFLDLLGQPDAVWVSGVVAALVSCVGIFGNWLVNRYMNRFRFRTTILIATSVVFTASTIAVGLVHSFWLAVPLFLLGSLMFDIFMPIKQAYLHQSIPSAQRATVISFDSMMGSAGGVVGQTGLGYVAREYGIGPGFVVGGAATLVAIPILLMLRRLGDRADHIKSSQELPPSAVPAPAIVGDR